MDPIFAKNAFSYANKKWLYSISYFDAYIFEFVAIRQTLFLFLSNFEQNALLF